MTDRQTNIITPTPERLAKGDIEVEDGQRGGRQIRSYGFPLDNYHRRGRLTDEQHDAGTEFAQLWYFAGMRSRVAQLAYTDIRGSLNPELLTEKSSEFRKAYLAICGTVERKIAFEVCCMGEYAGRGNFERLASALDDLVRHFRK